MKTIITVILIIVAVAAVLFIPVSYTHLTLPTIA